MMGGIWEEIAATRTASDRIWHPSLSLDMMARDWAGVALPLTLRSASRDNSPTETTWVDWFELEIFLPPDWNGDGTFDDIVIHIDIAIQLRLSVLGLNDVRVRIEDSPDYVTVTLNTFEWFALTLDVSNTSWSSGQLQLQLQHWGVGAAPPNIKSQTLSESDGPRSFIQVRRS